MATTKVLLGHYLPRMEILFLVCRLASHVIRLIANALDARGCFIAVGRMGRYMAMGRLIAEW